MIQKGNGSHKAKEWLSKAVGERGCGRMSQAQRSKNPL